MSQVEQQPPYGHWFIEKKKSHELEIKNIFVSPFCFS